MTGCLGRILLSFLKSGASYLETWSENLTVLTPDKSTRNRNDSDFCFAPVFPTVTHHRTNMPGGSRQVSLRAGTLEDMSTLLQQLLTLCVGSADEVDAVHGLLRHVLPQYQHGIIRDGAVVASRIEHLVTIDPGTPIVAREPHLYELVRGPVFTLLVQVAQVDLLCPKDFDAGSDNRVLSSAVFVLELHRPEQSVRRTFFSTKQHWDHRAGSPEITFNSDVTYGAWHRAWIKIGVQLGLDWNFIPSTNYDLGAHLRAPSLGRLRSSSQDPQVCNCQFDFCRVLCRS